MSCWSASRRRNLAGPSSALIARAYDVGWRRGNDDILVETNLRATPSS